MDNIKPKYWMNTSKKETKLYPVSDLEAATKFQEDDPVLIRFSLFFVGMVGYFAFALFSLTGGKDILSGLIGREGFPYLYVLTTLLWTLGVEALIWLVYYFASGFESNDNIQSNPLADYKELTSDIEPHDENFGIVRGISSPVNVVWGIGENKD